jgi:hypothetical protein
MINEALLFHYCLIAVSVLGLVWIIDVKPKEWRCEAFR